MLKKRPSKHQIRAELDAQVEAFIQRGGEIEEVEQGTSGYQDGPLKPSTLTTFEGPKSHTYVPEVVAAIEARKKARQKPVKAKPKPRRPTKKLIYDDFGEPVRWVWANDD